MNKYRLAIETLKKDLEGVPGFYKRNKEALQASRLIVSKALGDGNVYYGINTGFGFLKNKRISESQLEQLQRNLLLSHAVGVGAPIPLEIARAMLHIKIHALGQGFSGISENTFDRLIYFAENNLIPVIPKKGSLGASGDLAPLSHLALPLIGEGEFWDEAGEKPIKAAEVLRKRSLEPIKLQAKDGLSLVNGTEMMSAYGSHVLCGAKKLLKVVDILAAMSLEALRGNARPFDLRIHQIRPHRGQQVVSENIRKLLNESEIIQSHFTNEKVQDPYCLRCVPQVHGASRDALDYVSGVLEIEINSVTDNPIVFENGEIVSGGNFHGQPLALSLDFAAIALAELANISERRTYFLLDGHDELPILLIKDAGINSGFMIPQYTAASLVSENKILCHPASVDSIPTCLGQEDHVSMGSISATKLLEVYHNVEHVLAIELLSSAQALDYRRPLKAGLGVELAHAHIRKTVNHIEKDCGFQESIKNCVEMIRDGSLVDAVETKMGPLL